MRSCLTKSALVSLVFLIGTSAAFAAPQKAPEKLSTKLTNIVHPHKKHSKKSTTLHTKMSDKPVSSNKKK